MLALLVIAICVSLPFLVHPWHDATQDVLIERALGADGRSFKNALFTRLKQYGLLDVNPNAHLGGNRKIYSSKGDFGKINWVEQIT